MLFTAAVSIIFRFFPKLKTILKNSTYIDFGFISIIPLVTTNIRKLTCSSIILGYPAKRRQQHGFNI